MTTSSARPDRLRAWSGDTSSAVRTAAGAVERAAQALDRHLAGGGEVGSALHATTSARSALERLGSVASLATQVAAAFEAADAQDGALGTPGSVVEASDVWLSTTIAHVAGGLTDDALLAPVRAAEGQALAVSLRGRSVEEQLAAIEEAADDPDHGPAFAAGFLHGLGPDGLVDLVASARQEHVAGDLSRRTADAGLRALTALFQEAARTVAPAADPSALRAALAGDRPPSTVGVLDLDLLDALGTTAAGRDVLRNLVVGLPHPPQLGDPVGPPDLPTPVVVTLARTLLVPGLATRDHPGSGSRDLLRSRLRGASPDDAVLRLLARDPLAARGWEVGGPGRTSALAPFLAHASSAQADDLAAIVRGAYVESVERGWSRPYAIPTYGHVGPSPTTGAEALPDVIRAAGRAHGDPAMAAALAATLATHPVAFRLPASRSGYAARTDPDLVAAFATLAGDRRALREASDAVLADYATQARRAAARNPPTAVDVTDLLGDLADAHQVALALEEGAVEAGRHHDAVRAFAISAGSLALQTGAGYVGSAVGGPLAGAAGRYAAKAAGQAAYDRWVDSNDGRSEVPGQATARAEAHLLAVALAEDPAWRPLLRNPAALSQWDLVSSAEHRSAFRRWTETQDPRIAALLFELMDRER